MRGLCNLHLLAAIGTNSERGLRVYLVSYWPQTHHYRLVSVVVYLNAAWNLLTSWVYTCWSTNDPVHLAYMSPQGPPYHSCMSCRNWTCAGSNAPIDIWDTRDVDHNYTHYYSCLYHCCILDQRDQNICSVWYFQYVVYLLLSAVVMLLLSSLLHWGPWCCWWGRIYLCLQWCLFYREWMIRWLCW